MRDSNATVTAAHKHDWRITGQSHDRTYYRCATCGEEGVGL